MINKISMAVIALTFLIVAGVEAQVILSPQITGSVNQVYFFGSGYSTNVNQPMVYAGTAMSPTQVIFAEMHGILEFDADLTIQSGPFPTVNMTPYNWTAVLNSISISQAFSENGPAMDLFLHSLNDGQEDGLITELDFINYEATPIALLFSVIPEQGIVFSGIDVTESLRHDLFGPAPPEETLGFTFKPVNHKRYPTQTSVTINHLLPRIAVNVFPTATPLPCVHHGDVTMNGVITAEDAQRAFEIVMSLYVPTDEEACAADCNGDGDITAGDAQAIFGVVFGGACTDPIP